MHWRRSNYILPEHLRLLRFLLLFVSGLRLVYSNQLDNASPEYVFPTPLTSKLNESAAASLRQQTDTMSNSVSNTSLNDLYNDNGTQQMQIKYRERKRQERLLLIQRDILQMLGFSKEPNVTAGLSDEERQRMLQMYDRRLNGSMNETEDVVSDTVERSHH